MEKQEGVPVPVDDDVNDVPVPDPEVNVNEKTEEEEDEIRIHEIVPKQQLIKIMECPVCFEIPFPPILNCDQGHIVCSSCRPRLSQCAVCRSKFRGGRNYPLEHIILGSSFPCKFKDLGCKEFILGKTFSNHLQICPYNPVFVLCNLKRGTPCNNARIPCSQYLEHLKGQHDTTTGGQRNQSTYRFVQKEDSTQVHMGQMISTDYFEHNGEAFIQKWEFQNNLYYTWFCMLNSMEKTRETVEVMLSVSCAVSVNKASFSATLALQDASLPLKDVKATGQFLALHPNQLLCFDRNTAVMEIEGQPWELHWNSAVEIRSKISNTTLLITYQYEEEDDWDNDEVWE